MAAAKAGWASDPELAAARLILADRNFPLCELLRHDRRFELVYEDAIAAWNWLDARVPERGRRILYGHSLGGPIAAEVALRGGGAAVLVLESSFTSVADMTVLGGLVTQKLDLISRLAQLDLPVLILHGAEDKIVPPAMARQLYDVARGPKRLVMVEGAGHSWVVRRAGGQVFDALRELAAAPR